MQTITRIASVLSEMHAHPDGVGVIQLAEKLSLPPSSLHRLLQALKEQMFVWQDPESRKYNLGIGLLDIGWPVLENIGQREWRHFAHEQLSNLSVQVQKQAFIGLLIQDSVVIVEAIHPDREDHAPITVQCMARIPVHCGSSAKAILAFLPRANLDRILRYCNFRPYTMHTLATQRELLEHLTQVRKQGYALCNEEFQHGTAAVSVPVLDHQGCAFASLGLGPLTLDYAPAELEGMVAELNSVAQRVSRKFEAERTQNSPFPAAVHAERR